MKVDWERSLNPNAYLPGKEQSREVNCRHLPQFSSNSNEQIVLNFIERTFQHSMSFDLPKMMCNFVRIVISQQHKYMDPDFFQTRPGFPPNWNSCHLMQLTLKFGSCALHMTTWPILIEELLTLTALVKFSSQTTLIHSLKPHASLSSSPPLSWFSQ